MATNPFGWFRVTPDPPAWPAPPARVAGQTRLEARCGLGIRPDILCILGAPTNTPTPIAPSPTRTVQFIEFTYCHKRFPEQAITQKHAKYDPFINEIRSNRWKTKPLITITAGVRGAIHEQSITKLTDLNIPKTNIKNLMKSIHQNAINT
jgi:hypothetical protein